MIISLNLSAVNAAWLKAFNAAAEKALGAKVGISMIANILFNQARGAENQLKRAIISDKQAALKRKAMNEYARKVMAIDKRKPG